MYERKETADESIGKREKMVFNQTEGCVSLLSMKEK